MADILNLSFGCGNTLLASQLNQIVEAINQLANQNGAQRGITLNTNTRELSITNNSSTADLDSILPYGIKDGGSWDDFITFYRDSNNNYEVDINGSGGRQCDLGVTGNIRTGLTNESSYVRTDILLLKDGRNDSYIGKLYSSNGNLYYLYVDGSGQKTKYYPALLITRAKINLDGDTTGFELNVDIPQNQNNNNTIGLADTDSIGGIKLWVDGDDPLDTYDYPVKLNHNGSAYVTVDWSNQGTTLTGLMGNNAIGSESLPIYWSGSGFQACNMDTSGITAIDLPNNLNTTLNNGTVTIPAATNNSYGVVKLGYDNSSNSNRHPVASDNGSGLYVDLSNASVPSIEANDGVGDVLAIVQGAGNTKQIGWAQLSPNGVAGVSSIEFGYSSGNTLAFAQAATSNQTLKLVPGDNILLSSDTDHYPNSIKISALLEFQDLSDVPAYDLDGYLKYESGSLVWAPGTSSNEGLTSGSWANYLNGQTKDDNNLSDGYLYYTSSTGMSTTAVAPGSGIAGAIIGKTNLSINSNNKIVIPIAGNNGSYGVIGTEYTTNANDRNYKVLVDNSGNAYVNVPWTDSGARTYNSVSGGPTANQNLSFGGSFTVPLVILGTNGQISILNRTMTLPSGGSGLTGIKYQNSNSNVTTASSSSGYITLKAGTSNVSFDNATTGVLKISVSGNSNLTPATSNTLGGVKVFQRYEHPDYIDSLNYKLLIDDNDLAFVHVPWKAVYEDSIKNILLAITDFTACTVKIKNGNQIFYLSRLFNNNDPHSQGTYFYIKGTISGVTNPICQIVGTVIGAVSEGSSNYYKFLHFNETSGDSTSGVDETSSDYPFSVQSAIESTAVSAMNDVFGQNTFTGGATGVGFPQDINSINILYYVNAN